MGDEQFSLSWNNFHTNLSSGFNLLFQSEDLVDVTLAAEGRYLKAHKIVLSVCSQYFKELFRVNPCKHPIVILKDVSYSALRDLLQFMYQGEVSVSQEELGSLMKVAETLQIKGLTEETLDTASHLNQNGVKSIHVVDVKSLSDPRSALKRPKFAKKTKAPVPVKVPKLIEHDDCKDLESPNKTIMEPPDVSMLVESELIEPPIKPKTEPADEPSESLDYSQQSFSDMDMTGMLDTSLGESSQGSGCWKGDPTKQRPHDANSPGLYMFTRSRKGMPHLVLDSNLFRPSGRVGTKLRNHKYWECVQNRKTGCRARCMYYNGEIFLKCRDHNHNSPVDYIKQRERMGAIYSMYLDSDVEGMFQNSNF